MFDELAELCIPLGAPRAGVLIFARAVAAYEEAQAHSYGSSERAGGHILGRELVGAVLRIAGVTA
jgi:hypothetical protein